MMKLLDFLHRWTGGILGAVLAVLGLTGAILVHKEAWIDLPHAGDARMADAGALARLTAQLLSEPRGGESLIYASDRFGLVQLRRGEGAGAYASQSGEIVAAWSSEWERPELWLLDLHEHLFSGRAGGIVVGAFGCALVLFAISGTVLWWRTRRTFRLRLWPARMTGPAIRMHHRDLGIVAAPLLLFAGLTGSMMVFSPVAGAVLAVLSPPQQIKAALTAPQLASGPLSPQLDLGGVVQAAMARYPGAQLRLLSLPRNAGDPVTVRLKQDAEWLPNGRTLVWFDAADGRLLAHRDALTMPAGAQAYNMVYPLHAARVGGLTWRLVMTFAGLALVLLGSLAMWSFWRGRRSPISSPAAAREPLAEPAARSAP